MTAAWVPSSGGIEVGEFGMAVVPADELGRTDDARQVLARNAELAVVRRADGQDHGIVEFEQSSTATSRPTVTLPMKPTPSVSATLS